MPDDNGKLTPEEEQRGEWRPQWKRRKEKAQAAKLVRADLGVHYDWKIDDGTWADEKRAALDAYAQTGLWSEAERMSKIGRVELMRWMDEDEKFRSEWGRATAASVTRYEDELRKRALNGMEDNSSGRLLEKVLESEKPEKYSQKRQVEVTNRTVKEVVVSDLTLPEGWTRAMLEGAQDASS